MMLFKSIMVYYIPNQSVTTIHQLLLYTSVIYECEPIFQYKISDHTEYRLIKTSHNVSIVNTEDSCQRVTREPLHF